MTLWQVLVGLASLPSALKDILALQHIGSVSIATLTDHDVIIIESDSILSQRGREYLAQKVKQVWPNNRVIIWDSGLRMRVVSGDPERQAGVH